MLFQHDLKENEKLGGNTFMKTVRERNPLRGQGEV